MLFSRSASNLRRQRYRALNPRPSASRVVNSAARGLRSHPLPTLLNNIKRNSADHGRIANGMAMLVGVLQDFMAMSGYSLSAAVRTAVASYGPQVAGSAWGASALALAAAKAAVHRIPLAVVRFAVTLIFVFVVTPYRIQVRKESIERVLVRFKGLLANLLDGKEVDLRPLVSDLIMSFDAVDVKNMAYTVVQAILQTYVYNPYVPSAGPGTMCTMCASVACRTAKPKGRGGPVSGPSLARLADRAFKAVNMLLAASHKATLTQVARRAVDTYVFNQFIPMAARKVPGLSASVVMSSSVALKTIVLAISAALTPQMLSLTRLDYYAALHLSKFGVHIDQVALGKVLRAHAGTLAGFLRNDPKARIEPVLVDILKAANPLGATRGVLTAAVSRQATPEFCHLCSKAYGACMRF